MLTALLQDRSMQVVATAQVPDAHGGPAVVVWADRVFRKVGFVNDKLIYGEQSAWFAKDVVPFVPPAPDARLPRYSTTDPED